jgi:EmrB/QacA subfamily drug resistance transporter
MHMRDLPQRSKMYILAGVLLAMLLGALDATIVGPAMPSIVRELGGMQYLSWVFIIYSLASTIAIPIVGKLSDLYGRKYFYLGGITVFLAGSMLCGTAGSAYLDGIFTTLTGAPHEMFQLIVFRGIQGLGGGTMMANGMAIIGDLFAPRERGRYQGLMGGVFGLASVIGPAVGGWLTDNLSWRWIFFVNLPVGLVALAVLAVVMTKPEHGRSHKVDWWGSLALSAGLVPLLIALNLGGSKLAWDSAAILGLFAVALASLLAFGFFERRASEPILDLKLFRDRGFSASMVVLFFSGVGMFGSIMFLPLFLQVVVGRSASSSGALLMPMMLGMVGASIVTGQLISRTGRYKVFGIVGLAIAAMGMLLLSRLTVETSNASVALYMVMLGLGLGATMPLFTISLQSQYPKRIGEVTAAQQFFRSIGGTVGVALLGGVMNSVFARELTVLVQRDAGSFGSAAAQLTALTAEPTKLLNAGALQTLAAAMPPEAKPLLARFFVDVKEALATGISQTFFWGFILLAIAFTAMWFVREVPLADHPHLDSASEIGSEILAEEAVQPAEHEPVIVGDLKAC